MQDCAMFALTLLHSATNTHLQHLKVTGVGSYAAHKALQGYYEAIPDLVDAVVESYQGKYGLITDYPNSYHPAPKDPLAYMESLQKFVGEARGSLPQDSELQNEVDNIANLINSTVYKLRNLK